jgi:hypothetical protein
MRSLSFQVDNGPVFFTLLNMPAIQFNCLVSTYATRDQDRQKRSITSFLQTLAAGSAPQALRLFEERFPDARFRVSDPTIRPWTSPRWWIFSRPLSAPSLFIRGHLLVKSDARFIPVAGEIPQVTLF